MIDRIVIDVRGLMLALSDLIVMNLTVRARQVHPWHYHRFGLRRIVYHLKPI